jgi:outer membrane protein assembly factor BamB
MSRRPLRIALIVLMAATAAACSSKAKVREPAKLVRIDAPKVQVSDAWSRKLGKGAAGRPTGLRLDLQPDALFAAESGGRVYAIDPATGRQRWLIPTHLRICSGPTVSGDLVLLGTLDGEVVALKRADGQLAWRAKLSSEVLAAPAAAGDVVVARAGDGHTFGLSTADGHQLWSFERTVPTLTLRGNSAPVIEGNKVIIGLDNGRVTAVNLLDGNPLWEQPLSLPSGRTELERLADIDGALLSTLDGVVAASYGGDVALIDPVDGESHWKRTIKSSNGAAAGGNYVFVTDDDGVLWALDAATGAAAWKNEALKYRRLSPPAFYRGYVLAGDYQGYLHVFDPADGKLVGRTRVGKELIYSPMVATDAALYVMTVDGRLEALTLH